MCIENKQAIVNCELEILNTKNQVTEADGQPAVAQAAEPQALDGTPGGAMK